MRLGPHFAKPACRRGRTARGKGGFGGGAISGTRSRLKATGHHKAMTGTRFAGWTKSDISFTGFADLVTANWEMGFGCSRRCRCFIWSGDTVAGGNQNLVIGASAQTNDWRRRECERGFWSFDGDGGDD